MPSSGKTVVVGPSSMQRAFSAMIRVSISRGGWGQGTRDEQGRSADAARPQG